MEGQAELLIKSSISDDDFCVEKRIKVFEKNESFGHLSFFTGCTRDFSIRSMDYCQLAKIKQEDFIKLLKSQNKSDEDFQAFCMIRDKIMYMNDVEDIQMRCAICLQKTHLMKNCPILHYIPDKEFVIK